MGATIRGRVGLDKATPPAGGPLSPIEFEDCTFEGGFSGAHAHFHRLSFRHCRFRDSPNRTSAAEPPGRSAEVAPSAELVPSIDLCGATIGTDLDLRDVGPGGNGDHLWIRAAGAWIDGEVDLSRSRLKAPPARSEQLLSEASRDALDLSLAEIRGDFQFLNGGRCQGRINMRGLHITGDIWMSGAHVEVARGECIFLQSATIGGNLVFDGRPPKADGTGEVERLHAVGEINLLEIKLTGSLDINDMDLHPIPDEADPEKNDGGICVRLTGARVGGPVTIGSVRPKRSGSSQVEKSRIYGRVLLQRVQAAGRLTIRDVQLGARTSGANAPPTIDAASLDAKQVRVSAVEPLLWDEKRSREWAPAVRRLSVDLSGARIESLDVRASRFSGYFRAKPLTCVRGVTLDLWVGEEVDLGGSDIGGSLDISRLRLDADAGRLSLRDAGIGRALKFERPQGPNGRMLDGLVRAQTTALKCLPDTTLLETLWRYRSASGRALLCQAAFLRKRRLIHALDRPEALDEFVATHGHAVRTPRTAEEYALLSAAYAGKAEERAWIVPAPEGLPPFVESDPDAEREAETVAAAPGQAPAAAAGTAADAAQLKTASATAPPAAAPDATPAAAPDGSGAGPAAAETEAEPELLAALAALSAHLFKPATRVEAGKFLASGCFLRGKRLVRAEFTVTPAVGRVAVTAVLGKTVGPPLKNVPDARDLYTYHPDVEQGEDLWVIPSVLNRADTKELVQREKLEALLLPYVQPGSSIHGEVDLTDLSCDTLDDGGGRYWGNELKFDLDRFVYRQATWAEDLPDVGFRAWVSRHLNRLIAERAWSWLIDWRHWRETRLQREDYWAPWQIRRNWIYQQFKLKRGLTSPTQHRIRQSEYRSQPFEQAIRVARQEGREDFAVQFEILKRRIEWSLFSRRSRWPLLLAGTFIGTAWIVASGELHEASAVAIAGLLALVLVLTSPRWDKHPLLGLAVRALLAATVLVGTTLLLQKMSASDRGVSLLQAWENWRLLERPRNFLLAVLVMVALRYMSTTSDWLMRNLFGYLRLPINAITSLIVAFLIGWAAVDVANDRQMLVIDVEPVASLVARDDDRKVYVGSPRGETGARKVHCGDEIDEPLYALDVLIPLIDLRQEIRCEVGRAIPFDDEEESDRKTLAYVLELVFGPMLDTEVFWSTAKAFYAIAGWFLVSLSILTFANTNRNRAEPG